MFHLLPSWWHVFTNVVPSFLPLFILVNLFCHMGLHRVLDSYIVTWLYDIVPFNKNAVSYIFCLAFLINALSEQNLRLGYDFGQKTELRSLMCWCTILWGDDGIIEFMCSIKQFIASHHFLCTYVFQDNFRDRCSLNISVIDHVMFCLQWKKLIEKIFPPPPHSSTCYIYILYFLYTL